MKIFSCVLAIPLVIVADVAAEEPKTNLIHKQTLRQLAMEHVDCSMFYLATSLCAKENSDVAVQSRQASEIMMQRAYRLAAEANTTQQNVTLHGKLVLDEINSEIEGDCRKLVRLEDKYKTCKGLAEDFTVRGREILQTETEAGK